jgi:cytochrome d ubiquinol oxidase subunit II
VIQQRATKAATGAAIVAVVAFVAAGAWLRWGGIEGYAISSAINPAGLSNPMAKTVVRAADAWWRNYQVQPLLWLLPLVGVAGALLAVVLARAGRTLVAFVASALALAGIITTAGASMFPFVLPSSSTPAASLTVWDSVSSHFTLGLMFWVALIFTPIIVLYTGWAYRVMRGKVTVEHIHANEHSAY